MPFCSQRIPYRSPQTRRSFSVLVCCCRFIGQYNLSIGSPWSRSILCSIPRARDFGAELSVGRDGEYGREGEEEYAGSEGVGVAAP